MFISYCRRFSVALSVLFGRHAVGSVDVAVVFCRPTVGSLSFYWLGCQAFGSLSAYCRFASAVYRRPSVGCVSVCLTGFFLVSFS